jgi:2-polyprenyl-3-methyl-5-hydroxy-6-metoxy-1,4-benzoquinol methylase
MKKFISRFHLQGKKILEVGSGKGDMLDILKDAGAVAIGIEASSESVEAGQSAGRKMVTGYIGEIDKIEGSPFDAFVSFNYIEHMPNPGVIINKIYNNMTTEGVGFVTVPNLEYLLRTKCFYEFVADHLSYFTKQTLKYAFESNNFKVLDCYTINNDNDILAVVKKKKSKEIEVSIKKKEPINISGYFKEVEDLMKNLNQIVNRYKTENKKIAVWGAGHRTLALLALSKLSKIDYIVDSAKFKQGKFSPVLHLRILPPETLQKEKVDLVIVMVPGIYPDEVISTVKKMDVASDIAKLKDNKIEFI